jgi:hypothetical protein
MDLHTGQSAKMRCGYGSYFDDLAKIGSFSHLERYQIADWLGKESWDTIIHSTQTSFQHNITDEEDDGWRAEACAPSLESD